MNSELLSKMDELIGKINHIAVDGYISEITKCLEEHFTKKRSISKPIGFFHKPIHEPYFKIKENNNTIPKEEFENFISFMKTSEEMKSRFNVTEHKELISNCDYNGRGCEGMNCECNMNERVVGYFVKLN